MLPPDGGSPLPGLTHWSASRLPSLALIQERLRRVFPEGLEGRSAAVAERAARSLFVFLYTFAIEAVMDNRVRPAMVTTMSDQQAARQSVSERLAWWDAARRARRPDPIPER